MKNTLLLIFAFLSLEVFGMEIRIQCQALDNVSSCRINNGQGSFLSMNSQSIMFYEGAGCSEKICSWTGTVSPYALREGDNVANFNVRTVTSDMNLEIVHKYRFYFGGNFKHEFLSERRGYITDTNSTTINLDLAEIDPALYNEWLELRSEYEDVFSNSKSPKGRWDKLVSEKNEIIRKLNELRSQIAQIKDLDFDEIDPATLEALGIAESQVRILGARKIELESFERQSNSDLQNYQSTIIARYEAVRARARTYETELPDLPPKLDATPQNDQKVSAYVQEINNELLSILRSHDQAVLTEDFISLKKAIQNWKRVSDLAINLYTNTSDVNAAEKILLFKTVSDGFNQVFGQGVTNDLWKKTNEINSTVREALDRLAENEISEARRLRNVLNFKKIPETLKTDVSISLDSVVKLSDKLKTYSPNNEQQKEAKGIAEATLSVAMDSLTDGIERGSLSEVKKGNDSLSIGLMVLDVGLDMVPFVSSARSAYELFSGKNVVTGETLTDLDKSMAFVGLFVGLTGFNVAKIAPDSAFELVSKIGRKLNLGWTKTVSEVSENLPQVDNLLSYYKKLKKPIVRITNSAHINRYLTTKYPRFKNPAFAGTKVIERLTESGEEYCRLFSKFKDGKNSFTHPEGGFFVFRCTDLINKSLKEILEMGAIPSNDDVVGRFIAKIPSLANVTVFEGVAAQMGGKQGGAIQIFLDITDSRFITSIEELAQKVEVKDVFTGF